jgi:hypothetical protein
VSAQDARVPWEDSQGSRCAPAQVVIGGLGAATEPADAAAHVMVIDRRSFCDAGRSQRKASRGRHFLRRPDPG